MTDPTTPPDFARIAQYILLDNNRDGGIDLNGVYAAVTEALQSAYDQGHAAGEVQGREAEREYIAGTFDAKSKELTEASAPSSAIKTCDVTARLIRAFPPQEPSE